MDNEWDPRTLCRQNEKGAIPEDDALYVDMNAVRSGGELLPDAVGQVTQHETPAVGFIGQQFD